MTGKRFLIHTLFLLALPLIVALFGLSTGAAVALVAAALLWRWALSLSIWMAPPKYPELVLETISASHFVEKVRWCMDRLGVAYEEKPFGGTLNAFFLGRSVPALRFRAGAIRSSIGNSAEILRYLWGRYSVEQEERAGFLEPTAERLEFERQLDRCGVSLQVWIYYHILDDRELSLHAWGCNNPAIPLWQKLLLRLAFPLLRFLIRRSFRINRTRYEKSVQHIGAALADGETSLADGRQSLLGGDQLNYTDFCYAAMMGLWLQPPGYGGGMADSVRIEPDRAPRKMAADIETWRTSYPAASEYVENLYRSERL